MTACLWCGSGFEPRRDGGKAQRFCSPDCRLAFHRAARLWAIAAIDAGTLTVAALRNGPLATYTLVGRASSPSSVVRGGEGRDAHRRPPLRVVASERWADG